MKKTNEVKESAQWVKMWDDSIAIKNATLHQPVSVGGFATEKTINKDKLVGAQLKWHSHGLMISFRDVRALVPAPNVAMLIFEDAK
jgi:hypothetical protein